MLVFNVMSVSIYTCHVPHPSVSVKVKKPRSFEFHVISSTSKSCDQRREVVEMVYP